MNATQTATTGTEIQSATRSASAIALAGPPTTDAKANPDRIEPLLRPPPQSASDVSTQSDAHATQTTVSAGERRLRIAFAGCTVAALVGYIGWSYLAYARSWVKTDNAYLAAHIHTISSRVAGTIKEVLVNENQAISKGAVIARLDARDFEVRRQQALAQTAQARAQFHDAEARIAQASSQVAREQARATKARNNLARANSLYEGGSGAISKQELELARADSDATEAALQGAQSALKSAEATAAAAKAQEQFAQARLDEAQLQLSYTEIVAPADGRIGKKNLEIGNRVQPGQAVLALVQPDVWVNANFKETQLTHLKPGQSVRIRVDAFPGRVFRGTVDSLSPASGAQFALLPSDNATGNFTKIVQRVPVKIVLERASLGDCEGRLVAGMSAVVEIKLHE